MSGRGNPHPVKNAAWDVRIVPRRKPAPIDDAPQAGAGARFWRPTAKEIDAARNHPLSYWNQPHPLAPPGRRSRP